MTDRIAMVLSDIDGTLVRKDKSLVPDTIAAVRELHAAGIPLALTSSRPPGGFARVVAELGITTPIGAFNGGLIRDRDGTVLREHSLDPAAARLALDRIVEAGIEAWVYRGDDWVVRDPGTYYVDHETHTLGFGPTRVVERFDDELTGIGKIVAAGDDYEALRRLTSEIAEALGHSAAASMSQRYYLDITHPLAHKGEALTALAEILGVPTAKVAAIGDGQNDICMFERAGMSIAMGNGSDEVKAAATYTTGGNNETGWADAIRRHILGRG